MRTLLTGSKGQLARCFRDRLPENWELIATDSTSLDITDTEAVRNMVQNFQPDAIVNAAAFTAVDKAGPMSAPHLPSTPPPSTTLPLPPAPAKPALSISLRTMCSTAQTRPHTKRADYTNPQSVYG